MVNCFRYYRALECVSIASALSTALTIYPCQIRVHQRWQSKLQLPIARKEWRTATAGSSPQAVTRQHCDTHYFSRPRTHNLPIFGWLLVRRATSSVTDSPNANSSLGDRNCQHVRLCQCQPHAAWASVTRTNSNKASPGLTISVGVGGMLLLSQHLSVSVWRDAQFMQSPVFINEHVSSSLITWNLSNRQLSEAWANYSRRHRNPDGNALRRTNYALRSHQEVCGTTKFRPADGRPVSAVMPCCFYTVNC